MDLHPPQSVSEGKLRVRNFKMDSNNGKKDAVKKGSFFFLDVVILDI